jgi:hypothetical protein
MRFSGDHATAFTARSTSRSHAGSAPGASRTTTPIRDRRRNGAVMIRQPPGRTAVRVGRQAKRAGPRRLAPSDRCCGEMSCRRATSDTIAPGDRIPLRSVP